MVVEPFHTWPTSTKPTPSPKPKPTATQTKSWESAYAAADAGSLGVTPKKSEPTPKPAPLSSPPAPSVTHYDPKATHPSFTAPPPVVTFANPLNVSGSQSEGQGSTRPVSVFNPPEFDPSPRSTATPPSPYQLTDSDAAAGFVSGTGAGSLVHESQAVRNRTEAEAAFAAAEDFVAGTGVGSLLNESEGMPEERPPLPAAVAAEEQGDQYGGSGHDSDEPVVIVWPEGGGYFRHEYTWDEANGDWRQTAYEWGGPGGGTLGRDDFTEPDNSFRTPRESVDRQTPYERMQEHYDREGNNLNGYPNTIYPGMFPDGPIGPNYENYPEVDAIPDVVTDFFGVPTNTSPATGAGIGYALADAAILGVGAGSLAIPAAFYFLDLADKYDGPPTLEGPAPQRMEGTGLPRTDIDYSR